MATSDNSDRVLDELAKILEERSPSSIARISSLNERTIRRIKNKEVNKVRNETLLTLCKYLSKEREIGKIIDYFPEGAIKEALENSYGSFKQSHFNEGHVNLDSVIRNETSFIVYRLCSTHGGCKKSLIQSEFGKRGLIELEHLVASEVVSIDDEICSLVGDKDYRLPFSVTKKYAKSYFEFIKEEKWDSGENLLMIDVQNVNSEFRKKMKQKLRKVQNELYEESIKQENVGEIPVFFIVASDSLLF